MKILAINGSPNRTGSTAALVDILLEECKNLGARCEKVNIEDYSTVSCQKCFKFSERGVCTIDDDFSQLRALIHDSDGVIIGSPYYGGRPVEQMEAFLSRISCCSYENKEFLGKYFVGLCTSAIDDGSSVAKHCANLGMNAQVGGYHVSGYISEATMLDEGIKDLHNDEDIKKRAKEMAKKFLEDMKNKEEN